MLKTGVVHIGMPSDAVRLLMGWPKSINTTRTAHGTSQQWVYGDYSHPSYYYFENDKLTTIQY